jgi:pullulanase/glycogen debranching enzyme
MKTTYPPNTPQNKMDWEQHAKTTTDHDALERQLYALRKRLANCKQEQYYALKKKVENIQKILAERQRIKEWENYLAK